MKIKIGSLTSAIKAKKLLQSNGIRLSVAKFSSEAEGGCYYGFEIPESYILPVAAVLRRYGISYTPVS